MDAAPGQWSPVRDTGNDGGKGQKGCDEEEEDDFNINVGRAMDYLATDVKGMFSVAPRLEIFTPEVRLKVCMSSLVLLIDLGLMCAREHCCM